nr:uncharacterized protein LOC109748170 [Aegilops tauschii subsp. strangulata]
MRRVRAALRQWCRSKPSLRVLMDNNKHVVAYLNAVEELRSLSIVEAALTVFAAAKAEQLILWQTAAWSRRAKIRWCVSGDENTQFFHAAANCQARRNKVRVLVQDGVEHFDTDQKLRLATDYFKAILGQPATSMDTVDVGSLYTPLDLSELTAEFSWAEIVQAINCSPNNRSPGPDGFTNEFYKVFKLLIKDDLLRFFGDFHKNEVDLSSGFLKGRSIVENFALATEMIQYAHKRKLPVIALKLDFHKAFDNVSWCCLHKIFDARGFPQVWTNWICTLLSTGSSRVQLNGELGAPILAKKGFRQGDSLSPYLFILVADVLQRMCCQMFQCAAGRSR